MTGDASAACLPRFVPGIGPTLEHIEQEYRELLACADENSREARQHRDVLALADEVRRLDALIEAAALALAWVDEFDNLEGPLS